jgi:hypothetical protein
MPRIDPRLVTIMISAVILSTLLVLTIIKPKEEDALLLIGKEHLDAIVKRPISIGRDAEVSYTFMATRDFERVELRFSSLYERDPGVSISRPASRDAFPNMALMEARVVALGGEGEVIERQAEVNGSSYQATIVDYSRFLEVFSDGSMLSKLPLVFVILESGDEVRYFEGRSCFFLDPEDNLEYLTIWCSRTSPETRGSRYPSRSTSWRTVSVR